MAYPPPTRRLDDPAWAPRLMDAHPFAHLFTAHGGLAVTRLPFVTDRDGEGRPARLRGHLNASNPQAAGLDGAAALVAFSGPAAYISPHWRADTGRAGTYDYEAAHVHGVARLAPGIDFFRRLIDDLSALIEPAHAEVGGYPVWSTALAPEGYIDRLFPHIVAFAIDIQRVESIAKLHQGYSAADRRSVADHLARSHRQDSRAIGEKIRATLQP